LPDEINGIIFRYFYFTIYKYHMKSFRKIISAVVIAAIPLFTLAQSEKDTPKPNWFNLDLQQDGAFGISTEKAYQQLLKDKKGETVIVAVIDGGVDTEHEDLKSIIWTNPKEIPGNGKDDDKNGYIDDVHGWNFIGSAKGDVEFDNLEMVRLLRKYKPMYTAVVNSTPLSPKQRKEFQLYTRLVTDYTSNVQQAEMGFENISTIKKSMDEIVKKIGKATPTADDFDNYKSANDSESKVLRIIKSALKKDPDYTKFAKNINDGYKYYDTQIKYNLNMDYDPRSIVGDDYKNSKEHIYGNANVKGPDAEHGTHVSGIIGAVRDNAIGIKGVANNVRIMSVRTVPNGDERDKDVANAIRYAVDNGAKVINMSFGKSYAWDKSVVDAAVKYAESKDVLLVHAAGNDGESTEANNNFPTRIYTADTIDANFMNTPERKMPPGGGMNPANQPGGQGRSSIFGGGGMDNKPAPVKVNIDSIRNARPRAANWIEVGASGWKDDENLVAEFSNYGKSSVDVFAPGEKINSTIPDSKYEANDGTSMASPVVAGLAALIRSYYPSLTAVQVKDLIMKSVAKVDHKVRVREADGNTTKLPLTDISISGGVVNAYNALSLAQKTYGNPK
jgi:subtilisin family serine protease